MNLENQENRVQLIRDRVIYVRELDEPTPEGISESAKQILALSKDWDFFSIIVEFPSIAIPSAEVRQRVVAEVLPMKRKLTHVAVVTRPNIVLKVAIKFISAFSGFTSISLHTTRESALESILKANGLDVAKPDA